jgi:hypothetical protein
MIELNNYNALIFCANAAFDDYCAENNITSPLVLENEIWRKYNKWIKNGSGERWRMPIIMAEDYSEEDKEKLKQIKEYEKTYNKQKNNFILNYFIKYGQYQDIIKYQEDFNLPFDLIKDIRPCDDINKQCSFECFCFGHCDKEENKNES